METIRKEQQEIIKKSNKLSTQLIIKLLGSALISLFWVTFVWNFWEKGIYVLGINAFIFLSLFLSLFLWTLHNKSKINSTDYIWIIPFCLITLSFLIYDNPFLKITNILVLPILFAVFYNYSFLENNTAKHWSFALFKNILKRIFSCFYKLEKSMTLYLKLIMPVNEYKRKIITKVIIGLILFLLIALTVFIPLLSSADAVFATKIQTIYNWIKEVFSISLIYSKIIAFIVLSIFITSILFAWSKKFSYEETKTETEKLDPIISSIILGGILLIYLLFLWVQLERLLIGQLPFDFKETVYLVKSGFWQLFFLSIINITIYFFTYRKTIPVVQRILGTFTFVSFLLLASAGYRMALYVTYYGFSYEKFFASYTVVYCTILFIWLISRLFINKKADILKFLVILFIWMYSVVTILPIEQFILRTNVKFKKLENSRIRLYESTILSPDVLGLVKKYNKEGVLDENTFNYDYTRDKMIESDKKVDWTPWIERQEKIISDKKWYEKNIMNLIN